MYRLSLVMVGALTIVSCSDDVPSGETAGDATTTDVTTADATTADATTADATTADATTADATTADATTADATTADSTEGTTTPDTAETTTGSATFNESETNGPPPPNVTCGDLPPGVVGVPYSTVIVASGGQQPYDWDLNEPPRWLSLIAGDESAELAGVPTEAGVYQFSIQVFSDQSELNQVAPCELVIADE